MRFEALGPVRVLIDDGPIELRPAQRRLLASLLLDHGSWVTTDTLVDRMWGEAVPNTARSSLHVHLSAVRRQVPGVVNTGQGRYLLDLDEHQLDVSDFGALVAESVGQMNHGHFRDATDLASRAIAMWRGTPYQELEEVDAARGERARLFELSTTASATLARCLMLQGRVSESIAHLKAMLEGQPFNEALWEELIHAYYLAGRQVDALGAFRDAKRILGDELGLEPGPRLRALEDRVLIQDPELMAEARSEVPHNLPGHDSSFVGRDQDLSRVIELIRTGHLVTITGAPGVGKTRLATEVAARSMERFPAGVWFARLSGARSETDTLATISAAMAVTEAHEDLPFLFERVGRQPALLILDSCEHMIPVVQAAMASRAHGSRLRVLATSRVRLGTAEETVWPLRGLPVPQSRVGMWDSPALQLFADRVRAADPEIDLLRVDPDELVELCRRTGGIPLALELTARWLPSVDLAKAVDMAFLPSPVQGVDPPHHASVASAIAWSVALLSPDEQEALYSASVFASSFSQQGFREVCTPEGTDVDAAKLLGRLVESSLLGSEQANRGVRYRMLEPIREFGLEQLGSSGRSVEVSERHAALFTRSASVVEASGRRPEEAAALSDVDETIADYRIAMRHLIDHGRVDAASGVAVGLLQYWIARYLAWEGLTWLTECLAAGLGEDHRLRTLEAGGNLAFFAGDYQGSVGLFEELEQLAGARGDRQLEAVALYGMGRVEISRDAPLGESQLRRAMEAFLEVGDGERAGEALLQIGIEQAQGGRTEKAKSTLTEAAELFERSGFSRWASVYRHLSMVAWHEDDEEAARSYVEQAESLARESADRRVLTGALIQKALVEGKWANPVQASAALLEALPLVAGQQGVYFAQTAFGAIPVLIARGEWSLASRLMKHCDRIYRERGWAPLGERSAAARMFASQIAAGIAGSGDLPVSRPVDSAVLLEELTRVLTSISDSGQEAISVAGPTS